MDIRICSVLLEHMLLRISVVEDEHKSYTPQGIALGIDLGKARHNEDGHSQNEHLHRRTHLDLKLFPFNLPEYAI